MQLKKCGFSLIELLIYLAISSLCLLIVCGWASQIISNNVSMRLQHSMDFALLAAVDCCIRDLWEAPADSHQWIHTDADWIEWRKGDVTIGYRLNNHILIRTISLRTSKKHSSQVAAAVHSCTFTVKRQDHRVVGFFINLCLKNNEIERKCRNYVGLRNGDC